MAITFVIGRSGSGKTHRCFTEIIAHLRREPMGPPIFWLVPRQASFSTERQLTCAGGLGGFCRARVLSFQELGREILDDCGGSPVPQVTALGREMIIAHLLRQHEGKLRFFKSVARQPGLAQRLDSTFAEFERDGKEPADLGTLFDDLTTTASDIRRYNATLLDKIHDLHLIYQRYTEYLGQDRLDQHRRLLRVLSCIDQSKLFAGAIVYVDGFTEFTAYERQVLARLGKACRRVEIALPMDPKSPLLVDPHQFPDELSLFHAAEMTYRRLWFTVRQEETPVHEPAILLTENHRPRSSDLRAMERSLFDDAAVYVQNAEAPGIELLEAPDHRAEVDAAARRILELRAQGYRLREIAVLVRDLSVYHDIIETSFGDHGIAYFADRRRGTAHHPLPQFLRAVLMLAQEQWSHEWMMTLLKSGLADIPSHQADAIENYVLQHRIRGQQWAGEEPWSFHASGALSHDETANEHDDGDDESSAEQPTPTVLIDRQRRMLIKRLRPFFEATRSKRPLRDFTTALFDVMERFEVRRQLVNWMEQARLAGNHEQVGEHEQVWAKLTEMLSEQVDVLGDQPVTLGAFQEIIEASLEHFEFALTPPTVDQVLVGQVDRTIAPPLRAVLILGLNEGEFPRVDPEDSVLSDADRRELHARNMQVTPATDRRLLNENLPAYRAFSSSSDLLYASHVLSQSDGKPGAESLYFRKLRQMFPRASFTRLPRDVRNEAGLVGTPRQLVTGLMRWARAPVDAKAEPSPWPALYQWLTAYPCDGSRIDFTRFTGWRALSYRNIAELSPGISSTLFPAPLQAEIAQLETFAACPFRHFARFGLGLRRRVSDDGVSAMDLGHIYHQAMDRVVRFMIRRQKNWSNLPDGDRNDIVRGAILEIGRSLRNEVMLGSARNRYILQRIEKTLGRVIANQKAIEERGSFHPTMARVQFGHGRSGDVPSPGRLPPYRVQTPTGQQAMLRGRIDRVDLIENGVEFSVIDYKLGQSKLSLDEVYYGLSLQLLTHLLVLQASGQPLNGTSLSPAAAFYVQLLHRLRDVEHPDDAIGPDDPRFFLQSKPRGLIDEDYVRDLDHNISGQSDVINAKINKDLELASKGSSDVASPDEFAALLATVQQRLGELTDEILSGKIDVRPYMIRTQTPCPRCEYRSVCRFEPSAHSYRFLTPMNRETVLLKVLEEQGDAH